MKKLFVAALAVAILSLTSCGTGSNSILGGTWSYNGISYSAITAVGSTTARTLTATTGSTSEVDNVIFHFNTTNAYPPAPGSYTVVNNVNPGPTEVYIITNVGTKAYTVDVNGSASALVSVSGTKVSVSVPAVTFSNITGQAVASGSFTATITQNL